MPTAFRPSAHPNWINLRPESEMLTFKADLAAMARLIEAIAILILVLR
jgi:hypothetical protein